ncbi:MAG: NAD(P)/FAD-dependent oxidoreductase [Verrucomicrobiales bacterium]
MSEALKYDAIVIGGGPGGSATSTFLAKSGKKVLLLEKEVFPRFHIGESLLPYNRRIFEEMGVLPALEKEGFPIKRGAQFHLGNRSKSLKFIFSNGKFTREPEAFQVERARFDHILLNHARSCGVEVREGWTVGKYRAEPKEISISARDPAGKMVEFTGRFLIDASGRSNLTGNQENIRQLHPNLKKLALFGHFTGVQVDEGSASGDTVIVRLQDKWFWLIPVSKNKVSVGCVMDQTEFTQMRQPPAIVFESIWKSSSAMVERLREATLAGPIQATTDFSYYNKTFIGPRLLRVGDAAGFMDPIFSAGVYMAMYSGKLAAESVVKALNSGADGAAIFPAYEKRVQKAMKLYWDLVHQFYTSPFLEVFFEPREKFQIASAVNAALAGELEGGPKIEWRLKLFFLIVKAQSKLNFMPKLNFD